MANTQGQEDGSCVFDMLIQLAHLHGPDMLEGEMNVLSPIGIEASVAWRFGDSAKNVLYISGVRWVVISHARGYRQLALEISSKG